MKILILDDDQGRLDIFHCGLGVNHIVKGVKTAPECITELQREKYDWLFLDHDLDGKVFVPSGPGTGAEVAKWLYENPEHIPEKIFVHSFNPAGAKNIKGYLPQAVVCPGIWNKFHQGEVL